MQYLLPDPYALFTTILAASALTVGLLWILIRHHAVGIFLVLAVHAWAVVDTPPSVVVLGTHVYPADVLSLCAAGVGLGRLLVHGLPRRTGLLPLLGLTGLTLWSALRGIASFGPQAPVNDARVSFGYLLAAALYTATMPVGFPLERTLRRGWVAIALVFAVLCTTGWMRHGLHAVTEHVTADGMVIDSRPVSAAAALVLAQAAILLLYAPSDQRRQARATAVPDWLGRWVPAMVLLLFVVLLQHRTIWVVAVAMVMAGWALRRSSGRTRLLSFTIAALSVSLAVVAYQLGAFGTVGGTLATSAAEVQDSSSSFDWRVAGWQQLLAAPGSLVQWLSGMPFGSGYDRVVGGILVTVGPHNYYVHLGLRLGMVGLALLIAWYVLTWRRLRQEDAWSAALRVLMVGQLAFFVTYSADSEQGVLLGLCIWCLRTRAADSMSGQVAPGEPVVRLPGSAKPPASGAPTMPAMPGVSR
ncbi:O-antigen ligase family protein [Streptomyces sp. NPDC001165]|uniref:O-antigen ligase family protein n=1 Tax=Streptomyces sp. NPDC001165 TaxID=3364546 RepID=UPI0036A04437